MNALLAVEAHRQRDLAGAIETGGVLVSGVRAIHAAQPVGARRRDDGLHHGVPAVTGIDRVMLVGLANRRRRHPHRRREVARPRRSAPRDAAMRWRSRARGETRAPSRSAPRCRSAACSRDVGLDLRQQRVHELDVARRTDLRESSRHRRDRRPPRRPRRDRDRQTACRAR